ncbi:transposase [bacterium]|nr:transposase [bacterium]
MIENNGAITDIIGVSISIIIRGGLIQIETIIRKTLPLKGFKLSKAKLILDKILLINIIPRKNGRPICPVCGKRGPIYDTQPVRSWRHLAGFGIHVMIEYAPRRVKCRNCHRVITE